MLKLVYRLYSLELPRWGDSNENTQHTFMLKKIKKIYLLCLLTSAMINPHWLELPLSQTHFHGSQGVRAIEVRLYIYYIIFSHLYSGSKNLNQSARNSAVKWVFSFQNNPKILSPFSEMDLDFLDCSGREKKYGSANRNLINTVELQWLEHIWDHEN